MPTVTIHQAKTQLSKLLVRVEAGEEVIIARGKNPVAKLSPLRGAPRPVFGAMKGIWPDLPDSFWFDPLPEEELRSWEGAGEDPAR